MKHTSFSLIAFVAVCGTVAVSMSAVANEQVVSRTETTYTSQNERIMDGYTPLDEIDNSVKTSTRTYKVPAPATTQQAPVATQGVATQAPMYIQQQPMVVHQPAGSVPAAVTTTKEVPAAGICAAGANCPGTVTSISYTQSPVKVQYPVVRQYPVTVEHPVTVNRDVTVRQPVVVQQPVVIQKPVMVQQPVMVERAPAYVQQQPVVMQQQASYVQGKPVVVQAPAGQVLPPCTNGFCQ
ncbi:MAG: hypothetical protein E7014_01870 [Alphaproteobacteria bacterium]|nr:hypothetical protein [Alphaproteobacteria bacterium]